MKVVKRVIIILFIISAATLGIGIYQSTSYVDHNPPVMTCSTDMLEIKIKDGKDKMIQGIQAMDDKDGDVSDSIQIENIRKDPSKGNHVFLVKYVAFDQSNNIGRIERNVILEGYYSPHFEMKEPLRFAQNKSVSLLQNISAIDSIDGDISPFVTIEGADELSESPIPGFYNCILGVTNSLGDEVELPVTIEIYEDNIMERSLRPNIYLSKYIVYLKEGEPFDPNSYLDYIYDLENKNIDFGAMVEIKENGETKKVTQAEADKKEGSWVNISRIKCDSNVDTGKTGVYKAIYSYTTDSKDNSCSVDLIVVVE